MQFSHVDTKCFQRFLDEFSQAYPDRLNLIQLDNGRFHTSKTKARDVRIFQQYISIFVL